MTDTMTALTGTVPLPGMPTPPAAQQPAEGARPINMALTLAPQPETRDAATSHAWVRHYAALGLAACAEFRAAHRTLPPNPALGSRPDLGHLALLGNTAIAAAIAFLGHLDAPTRLWDLTPELGALNGECVEEWLTEVLVRYGINPGHIDPDLDPADFTPVAQS